MNSPRQTILLKISGQIFAKKDSVFNKSLIFDIVGQLKQLQKIINFGIVVGGGNFFRGRKCGKEFGLNRTAADSIGMLATVMNALMLQDFFTQKNVSSTVLSCIHIPQFVPSLNSNALRKALLEKKLIIFAGGTGNPYFSTDTNAIIRALQMGATEVWKATNVDGVYDEDPFLNKKSRFIQKISYDDALAKGLNVMDLTALALAKENNLTTRVFNLFAKDSLLCAAEKKDFGSIILNS
jgi:uridylate kinase